MQPFLLLLAPQRVPKGTNLACHVVRSPCCCLARKRCRATSATTTTTIISTTTTTTTTTTRLMIAEASFESQQRRRRQSLHKRSRTPRPLTEAQTHARSAIPNARWLAAAMPEHLAVQVLAGCCRTRTPGRPDSQAINPPTTASGESTGGIADED